MEVKLQKKQDIYFFLSFIMVLFLNVISNVGNSLIESVCNLLENMADAPKSLFSPYLFLKHTVFNF